MLPDTSCAFHSKRAFRLSRHWNTTPASDGDSELGVGHDVLSRHHCFSASSCFVRKFGIPPTLGGATVFSIISRCGCLYPFLNKRFNKSANSDEQHSRNINLAVIIKTVARQPLQQLFRLIGVDAVTLDRQFRSIR